MWTASPSAPPRSKTVAMSREQRHSDMRFALLMNLDLNIFDPALHGTPGPLAPAAGTPVGHAQRNAFVGAAQICGRAPLRPCSSRCRSSLRWRCAKVRASPRAPAARPPGRERGWGVGRGA